MRQRNIDILNGPVTKNIFVFAIPIFISNFVNVLFNAVDLMVVGQFCDSKSVAAVGATSTTTALIVNFFTGFAVAATVFVSHFIGAKDDEKISRAVHALISFAIFLGLICAVFGSVFSRDILKLINTPKEILDLSTLYLKIYFLSSFMCVVGTFSSNILIASGDSKTPTFSSLVSGLTNVFFNIIFVVGFKIGVAGVAWGTFLANAVAVFILLKTLIKRDDAIKLDFKKIRFDFYYYKKIFTLGLPSAAETSMFQIANIIIQSSVNLFGVTAVAGNAGASTISTFLNTITSAFSGATIVFVGQYFGAKRYLEIKKIHKKIMLITTVITVFASAMVIIFARQCLYLFLKDDLEAINIGVRKIQIVCPFNFAYSILQCTSGAIRGLGKTTKPMINNLIGICAFRIIYIFTVFRIPRFHTLEMLFMTFPLSLTITAILMIIELKRELKKLTNKKTA